MKLSIPKTLNCSSKVAQKAIVKKFNKNSKEIVRKIIHIGIGPLIPIAQFLKIDQNSALIFTGIISLMVLINYTY